MSRWPRLLVYVSALEDCLELITRGNTFLGFEIKGFQHYFWIWIWLIFYFYGFEIWRFLYFLVFIYREVDLGSWCELGGPWSDRKPLHSNVEPTQAIESLQNRQKIIRSVLMFRKIISEVFWWCKSFSNPLRAAEKIQINCASDWITPKPPKTHQKCLGVHENRFCIIKTFQKRFSWTSRHFWWFFGGFGVIFTCFCSSIATTRAYYHSGGDFSHLRDRKNARKQGLRFCIRFAVDREGGLDCDFEISWKNWLFVFLELKSVKWPHDN